MVPPLGDSASAAAARNQATERDARQERIAQACQRMSAEDARREQLTQQCQAALRRERIAAQYPRGDDEVERQAMIDLQCRLEAEGDLDTAQASMRRTISARLSAAAEERERLNRLGRTAETEIAAPLQSSSPT